MVLDKPAQPLTLKEVPAPKPGPGQILIRVHVCGIYCFFLFKKILILFLIVPYLGQEYSHC